MAIDDLSSINKCYSCEGDDPEIEVFELCFDSFINETGLKNNLKTCFISDKQLSQLAVSLNKSKPDILREDIFPTNGSIKSGDFGEIAFQHLFQKGEKLHFFYYRWRHKEQNNKSVAGSDLLGASFNTDKNTPHKNDKLFVIEAKASFSKEKDTIIQSAIDSLQKDYKGRVSKTLFSTLRKRLDEDKSAQTADVIRFLDVSMPPFKIEFIAGIV